MVLSFLRGRVLPGGAAKFGAADDISCLRAGLIASVPSPTRRSADRRCGTVCGGPQLPQRLSQSVFESTSKNSTTRTPRSIQSAGDQTLCCERGPVAGRSAVVSQCMAGSMPTSKTSGASAHRAAGGVEAGYAGREVRITRVRVEEGLAEIAEHPVFLFPARDRDGRAFDVLRYSVSNSRNPWELRSSTWRAGETRRLRFPDGFARPARGKS